MTRDPLFSFTPAVTLSQKAAKFARHDWPFFRCIICISLCRAVLHLEIQVSQSKQLSISGASTQTNWERHFADCKEKLHLLMVFCYLSPWADCPERLWHLPHCRYSRTVGTQSCAMCSGMSLLEQGGWIRWPTVVKLTCSVILWLAYFWESNFTKKKCICLFTSAPLSSILPMPAHQQVINLCQMLVLKWVLLSHFTGWSDKSRCIKNVDDL